MQRTTAAHDDLLLVAIGDHCREGLAGRFLLGYVTGALTLGYRRVEVPGAPPTNRGGPRTAPSPDPVTAALVRQHYEWVRDGMPLAEGLRRWRAAGGPCTLAPPPATFFLTAARPDSPFHPGAPPKRRGSFFARTDPLSR